MVKSLISIVGMLVVAQAYAVNPATQEDQERGGQAIQVVEKQQERQLRRQIKYFKGHAGCIYKILRLKHKVSDLLELATHEESALVRKILAAEDELADTSRDALLALDGTLFDNPSKAIQEVAKKVRYSISNDGDNTVSYLLALPRPPSTF